MSPSITTLRTVSLALASASRQLKNRSFSARSPRQRSTTTKKSFSTTSKMSTEETQLRELIKDQVTTANKEEFLAKMPQNAWFIRPSGNPASKEIMVEMMSSGDITEAKTELVEIKHVEVMQDCAYAVLIAKSSFDYKQTKNEDVYTQSCFFKKTSDGKFELAWGHRSTGRGFEEDLPAPWP